MLVANGAKCDDLNARCSGIWSAGRGPSTAKLVKFSAVITVGNGSVLRTVGLGISHTVEHNYFVRRVDVEGMIERKRGLIVIECGVGGGVVYGNGSVRKASNQLLHVPNALDPGDRRTERRAVPEEQIHAANNELNSTGSGTTHTRS